MLAERAGELCQKSHENWLQGTTERLCCMPLAPWHELTFVAAIAVAKDCNWLAETSDICASSTSCAIPFFAGHETRAWGQVRNFVEELSWRTCSTDQRDTSWKQEVRAFVEPGLLRRPSRFRLFSVWCCTWEVVEKSTPPCTHVIAWHTASVRVRETTIPFWVLSFRQKLFYAAGYPPKNCVYLSHSSLSSHTSTKVPVRKEQEPNKGLLRMFGLKK